MLEQISRNITILQRYMAHESVDELSKKLGLTSTRIYKIIRTEARKLIPDEEGRIQFMCCKQIREEFKERLL